MQLILPKINRYKSITIVPLGGSSMNEKELLEILDSIEKGFLHLETLPSHNAYSADEIVVSLLPLVKALNIEIFGYEQLKNYELLCQVPTENMITNEYISIGTRWTLLIRELLYERSQLSNSIDKDFFKIMIATEYVDYTLLFDSALDALLRNSKESLDFYQLLFQEYAHFWGTLDIPNNRYDIIINRVHTLINHKEDFKWLYNQLADYRSKVVLVKMLQNWLTFDVCKIQEMKENNFDDYYDLDLVKMKKDEVFVDLGAYTGDSAFQFIQTFQNYKHIYCYEITPEQIPVIQNTLEPYENITISNKAVSDINGIAQFALKPDSSSNVLSHIDQSIDNAYVDIEVVTLDSDIKEPISTIKMDIEGSEKSALLGAKNHIKNDKPKLLVCVYHSNTDIFEIPKLISEIRPDYKFYLRSNGNTWTPTEIVLFAI